MTDRSEPKFKVGDRVRVSDGCHGYVVGCHGYVVGLHDDTRHVWVLRIDPEVDGPLTYRENQCELAPPDPTEALIAAAYAMTEAWHEGTPGEKDTAADDLINAAIAHREAQP